MPLSVDDPTIKLSGRLSIVRLSMFMLRSMEIWREVVDDCQKALILIAIIAIRGERFTRGEGLQMPLRDLRAARPGPLNRLCNVSSVAAATGFNRETTRRKVNELIDAGILIRDDHRQLSFPPHFMEVDSATDIVRRQLEAIVRLTNDLARDGVLISSNPAVTPPIPMVVDSDVPPVLPTCA